MFNFERKNNAESFKVYDSIASVSDIVDDHIRAYYGRTAIRYDVGDYYDSCEYQDYHFYVKAMIQFLNKGNTEQKVIATFCKNRIEWDMAALASFYTGNMIFPLDTKTNEVELKHLLKLNPPHMIVVSRPQVERVRELNAELGLNATLIVADLFDAFEDNGYEEFLLNAGELSVKVISETYSEDEGITKSTMLERWDTVLGHYPTSGTTNLPKIVQVTHGNIVNEINEAIDVINLRPREEVLNIGPYTHIGTLVEFLTSKTRGFTVCYFTREPDEDDVLEDEIKKLKKQGVRIKALMAVPKFWIYLLKELLEEMKNKPVLHGLYNHLISIEKSGDLYDIGTLDKAKLTAMRSVLRHKLGGYFSYGVSSSMKLDGALVEIFGKLGITLIDIYGATECCGIISRNHLNDVNPGSCGRIISILDYRLVEKTRVPGIDHEVGILEVKGPTVAHSYVGDTQEMEMTDDGYFNTGDLAYVNDNGLLFLVGRKKELMLWDDGTYVDPQRMSNLLVRSVFVKDAMVTRLNPSDNFLSVYLLPDYNRIKKDPAWAREINTGVSERLALRSRMEQAIDYASSIAKITPELDKREIYLLPQALERTPTHKIKFNFEMNRLHLAEKI